MRLGTMAQDLGATARSTQDEIARLARTMDLVHGDRGVEAVDRNIEQATGQGEWDDVSKWHRVRLRLIRLQQERFLNERLAR